MDDIIKEIEKLRREHTELLEALIELTKEIIDYDPYKYIELIEKITSKTWKEICKK